MKSIELAKKLYQEKTKNIILNEKDNDEKKKI